MNDNMDLSNFLLKARVIINIASVGRVDENLKKTINNKIMILIEALKNHSQDPRVSYCLEKTGLSGPELKFKMSTFNEFANKIWDTHEYFSQNIYEENWTDLHFIGLVNKYWPEIKKWIKKILKIINSLLESLKTMFLGVATLPMPNLDKPQECFSISLKEAIDSALIADSIGEFKDILECFLD